MIATMKIQIMKKIKLKFWTYLIIPFSLLLAPSELIIKGDYSGEDPIFIESSQKLTYENLPPAQKEVYNQLGPLFQKIYINVLNEEERQRVLLYVKRGVSPFEAIQVILRAEERKYFKQREKKSLSPSQRTESNTLDNKSLY
jgi:hypothetical protein